MGGSLGRGCGLGLARWEGSHVECEESACPKGWEILAGGPVGMWARLEGAGVGRGWEWNINRNRV